jgi:hypothetical protein
MRNDSFKEWLHDSHSRLAASRGRDLYVESFSQSVKSLILALFGETAAQREL